MEGTYYQRHREKALAYQRKYHAEHREECLAYHRDYYATILRDKRHAYSASKPKKVKPPPRIVTKKTFLAPDSVTRNPRKPRVKPIVVAHITSDTVITGGKVEALPGVILDWQNL